MNAPQLLWLAVYAAALVALGLWIGRRVSSSSDFFVAGRRLGPGLLFATLLAANIGAGSTVGAAGRGYASGIAAWWWVGSAGIGTLLLALWIGPKMWRVGKEHDLRTVGDYLELRFGHRVRFVIAALLWVGTLAILAGQLIALAWVLQVVADVPKLWGCLIGGAIMTIYFTAGGLLTSAWVNVVQLSVLLIGFAVAVPVLLSRLGGWSAVQASAPPEIETYWHFWHSGSAGWTWMFLLVPAFLVSPGILQKVYGARDERSVRIGVGLCGVALLLFAAVPAILGVLARSLDPTLANPEMALPVVLMEGLPGALGTLGLAAVVSAEISSADAILFMLSTSLSEDLYKRYLRPGASDRQVLKVARWGAVAGGVLGVGLATLLPNVVSALSIFYSLLGVSLFVPVVAGLTTRLGRERAALAAIALGVAGYLVARYTELPLPAWATANFIGLVAAAIAFLVVHTIVPRIQRAS